MITALASEPQYLATIAPIWAALDPALRGELLVPDHLFPDALRYGVTPSPWRFPMGTGLVASMRDLRFMDGQPTILCEHGAGQSYRGRPESWRHPNYAGGAERDNVIGFLVPGPAAAEPTRAYYLDVPCVEVGNVRHDHLAAIPTTNHERTIAYAFHWGAGVCPESGSAWYEWRDHLDLLVDEFRVLGTAHPRAFQEVEAWYGQHGIIPVESFETIVAEADVLIADNSSVMYDWAALDRPVVALNSTAWRKDVHHGLRFWDAIPGPDVDVAADLRYAVDQADSRHGRKLRHRGAEAAYAYTEGAAKRAADAITRMVS